MATVPELLERVARVKYIKICTDCPGAQRKCQRSSDA
jgi:hypothetical protein